MVNKKIWEAMRQNRSLLEFEALQPTVMSYLRDVRERQKELGADILDSV